MHIKGNRCYFCSLTILSLLYNFLKDKHKTIRDFSFKYYENYFDVHRTLYTLFGGVFTLAETITMKGQEVKFVLSFII
jgi:hypothetical protein